MDTYLVELFLFFFNLFSLNSSFLSLYQGGEVTRPLDPSPLSSSGPLPPPLIPLPKRRASDCEPAEEEEGKEAPTLPQDLGTNLGLELGEPEVAAEAYSEIGGTPREEEREELSDAELDDTGATWELKTIPDVNLVAIFIFLLCSLIILLFLTPALSLQPSPARIQKSQESQEFDSLFDCVAGPQVPSPKDEEPPLLSDNDLAVFDPCFKKGKSKINVM